MDAKLKILSDMLVNTTDDRSCEDARRLPKADPSYTQQMSELDRLIGEATARVEEAAAQERLRKERTPEAYKKIEALLTDAAGRREPWTLVEAQPRRRLSRKTVLPEIAPVYGWAFPFPDRVYNDHSGIAATVGGRVFLATYSEPVEKRHNGGVYMVRNAYPPYDAWPSGGPLRDPDDVITTGAEGLAERIAHAVVHGMEWYTPFRGWASDGETLSGFVARLPVVLTIPQRNTDEL